MKTATLPSDNEQSPRVPYDEIILRAEQDERGRIARELHDDLAQQLVAMQFALEALGSVDRSEDAETIRRSMVAGMVAIRLQIRTLAYAVPPPELQGIGLCAALADFAVGFERRTGLGVHHSLPRARLDLDPAAEVALYRIAQESLANIERHAHARRVDIELVDATGRLRLTIGDDGVGICPALADGKTVRNHGVGLASMRERMAQVGGSLTIARTSRGTMVRAELPRPSSP